MYLIHKGDDAMADKTLLSGSTTLLVLKLLEDGEMYGYQMIEELRRRSDRTFELKAGTLYPLLHTLEQQGWVVSRDGEAGGRVRRYYAITASGRAALEAQREQWNAYAAGVRGVLEGGVTCGA